MLKLNLLILNKHLKLDKKKNLFFIFFFIQNWVKGFPNEAEPKKGNEKGNTKGDDLVAPNNPLLKKDPSKYISSIGLTAWLNSSKLYFWY